MNITAEESILPSWNDPTLKAGTKIRTALWLLSEVGIGNVFTKEEHRLAFPGVAQADRRLRDLREAGWIIQTSLEDVSLNSNEQRFVAAGSPVWDPAAKKPANSGSVTAKQRRAIFSEANYQCEICGIAGGEMYPDLPTMSATLSISKVTQNVVGGSEAQHIVECKRCRAGGSRLVNLAEFLMEIEELAHADRKMLAYLSSQTANSPLFKVWAKYRLLTKSDMQKARSHILDALK